MLTDVQLRVVPVDQIRPHEIEDPGRERRIEERLRDDGVLRDPLLVGAVRDLEGYILLDGTNRRRALERLNIPAALVQIVDYADPQTVQLRTWCHAVPISIEGIADRAAAIPGLRISALGVLAAPDALASPETLAVLLNRGQRYALIRDGDGESRAAQLRRFVDLYEEKMTRVECAPDEIEERVSTILNDIGRPATLIAFPPFTRAQVASMALSGTLIPAGITRHVIQRGRALRVNLPLKVLVLPAGLDAANQALDDHLHQMRPRAYHEPTILFDS